MAPTILKDGPDDSVSVRRKTRLRGLGRHESRLHQASEDRFAFPVVHCVFTLLLDCKIEVCLFPKELNENVANCTFLTHLSMRLVRVMILDVERSTCGNFLVTFQQCCAAHIRVAVVHVSVTFVTP